MAAEVEAVSPEDWGPADHRPAEAVVEGERGAGERYLLRVAGDPPAQWRVRIDPDQMRR